MQPGCVTYFSRWSARFFWDVAVWLSKGQREADKAVKADREIVRLRDCKSTIVCEVGELTSNLSISANTCDRTYYNGTQGGATTRERKHRRPKVSRTKLITERKNNKTNPTTQGWIGILTRLLKMAYFDLPLQPKIEFFCCCCTKFRFLTVNQLFHRAIIDNCWIFLFLPSPILDWKGEFSKTVSSH